MTTLREAAEMALYALNRLKTREHVDEEIAVLRAALAEESKAEPVAWMDREGDIYKMPEIKGWAPPHTLLYITPPQRKPLTDEEILAALGIDGYDIMAIEFSRAIERAHGIGGEE